MIIWEWDQNLIFLKFLNSLKIIMKSIKLQITKKKKSIASPVWFHIQYVLFGLVNIYLFTLKIYYTGLYSVIQINYPWWFFLCQNFLNARFIDHFITDNIIIHIRLNIKIKVPHYNYCLSYYSHLVVKILKIKYHIAISK